MSTQIKYADRTLFELPPLSPRSDEVPHEERIKTVEEKIIAASESLQDATKEAARILDGSEDPVPGAISQLYSVAKAQSYLGHAHRQCRRLRDMDVGHGSSGYPSLETSLEGAQKKLSGDRYGYPPIESGMDAARDDVEEALQYLADFRERQQATSESHRELKDQLEGGVWVQRTRTILTRLLFAAIAVDILSWLASYAGVDVGFDVHQYVVDPLLAAVGVLLGLLLVRWIVIHVQD